MGLRRFERCLFADIKWLVDIEAWGFVNIRHVFVINHKYNVLHVLFANLALLSF